MFDFFKQITGLSDNYQDSPLVNIAEGILGKAAGEALTKAKVPGDLEFNTPKIDVLTGAVSKNSQATTPTSQNSAGSGDALDRDAYRFGDPAITSPENLSNPRTLSERDFNDTSDLGAISFTINDPTAPGAGTLNISAYSRFFLTSVAEAEQEKFQVVETFTNYYAFFFGKRPPFYRYTGIFLNDQNHQWNNDFKFFYENFFRGTKATELSGSCSMQYDGRLVSGLFIGLSMQQVADVDKGVPFSLDMLVFDHTPLRFSADIKELITRRQQEVVRVAQEIQARIAELNKNIKENSYKFAKSSAAKGKLLVKLKKSGSKPAKETPDTLVAAGYVPSAKQETRAGKNRGES